MANIDVYRAESLAAGIATLANNIGMDHNSISEIDALFEGDAVTIVITTTKDGDLTIISVLATLADNPTVVHTKATEMAAVELWLEHGWRRNLQPEADGSIRLTC